MMEKVFFGKRVLFTDDEHKKMLARFDLKKVSLSVSHHEIADTECMLCNKFMFSDDNEHCTHCPLNQFKLDDTDAMSVGCTQLLRDVAARHKLLEGFHSVWLGNDHIYWRRHNNHEARRYVQLIHRELSEFTKTKRRRR